jgi:hypothetical protein
MKEQANDKTTTSNEAARTKRKLNLKCEAKNTKKKKKRTLAKPQTMQTKHTNWECPNWVLPFILA